MEVLHASAPGAKVRVMRAAYHSTAASGAPSSSYLMHSSRQVISSGFNFLEQPSSLASKPLEISSTPLESLPDSEVEKENYKVTEPDDYDISEPSKWRGSSGKNSIRMPSEESSSTDNMSIIDLDSRASSRSTLQRSFHNKQKEEITRIHNLNTRVSPLLDAPVALSTLKYTSLLNNSDDWNSRRKSYSFEDTSPINKSISPENKYFPKDLSTDSGICKSSEVVNDQHNSTTKYGIIPENTSYNPEETFTEWLSKNRTTSYKGMTPPKPMNITDSSKNIDKVTVKSSGKVTITLPTENYNEKIIEISKPDDYDRKTKKVEFCKTELHFAVDTGTVNIIATDEKPPPSNDFRRRRSAFVPLNEKIDRSITLFGDKSDVLETNILENVTLSSELEADENTAATKGILKNKIPKPKPYLLGENMVFGDFSEKDDLGTSKHLTSTSAVSLINRQLQSGRQSDDTISSCTSDPSTFVINNSFGAKSKDPVKSSSHTSPKSEFTESLLKPGLRGLNIRPVPQPQSSTKIRELRGSDLAYFGIQKSEKPKIVHSQDNMQEEIFHSVKLVQKISNSVCNSEAESDDAPEYQNILPNHSFAMTPTPKARTKYGEEVKNTSELRILKPIIEQQTNTSREQIKQRKDLVKQTRLDNTVSAKSSKEFSPKTKDIKHDFSSPGKKYNSLKKVKNDKENTTTKLSSKIKPDKVNQEPPLYINLQAKLERKTTSPNTIIHKVPDPLRSVNRNKTKSKEKDGTKTRSNESNDKNDKYINKEQISLVNDKKNERNSLTKRQAPRRTEKLTTPDHLQEKCHRQRSKDRTKLNTSSSDSKRESPYDSDSLRKKKHRELAKISEGDVYKPKKRDEIIEQHPLKISKVTDKNDNFSNTKISLKTNGETMDSKYTIRSSVNKTGRISNARANAEKSSNLKRSKYVINYDDKNGTVSSICKIKSGPGTYTRKLISVDNKEPQEYTNDKSLNKIALKK